MTLGELIRAEIRATGPMSVARYMELCLGHPEHGYYTTRDPLGAAGDFVTAPEVSQMFGEMIGLWLVQAWQDQGCPAPFRLVEFGPGRGTLMADALRAARLVPDFAAAADLWLVETSPALRRAQAERLPGAQWAARFEEVPEGPVFAVANEFFDALPVHQFIVGPDGLREQVVGLGPEGALIWGLTEPLPGQMPDRHDWVDHCPAGEAVAQALGARIAADGGAALVIDYGYTATDRPGGPTLQAVRAHEKADPLAEPGEADLTCLVDFDRLARHFAPARGRIATQGEFLVSLGIVQRAERLAAAAPDRADEIAGQLRRLADPAEMGRLFKVLAATPESAPAPPGFPYTTEAT